jgi:cold shock CspA family protein
MPSGIVAELSPSKGYGFVLDSESGSYIRFDIQALAEEVMLLDKVNYSIVELYPGRVAVNIRRQYQINNLEFDHDTDGRQYRSGSVGDGT